MPSPALFGISVAFGLTVWGAVAWHYIWPALRERPSPENLKPILLLHGFRFLGLAFVVPGVVVSPELPAAILILRKRLAQGSLRIRNFAI
jgi:hypothetical protein